MQTHVTEFRNDMESIIDIRNNILKQRGQFMKGNLIFFMPIPEDIDLVKIINDRIEKLGDTKYYQKLPMSETEMVNGYNLYNISNVIMPIDKFEKIWDDKENIDDEKFSDIFRNSTCSVWWKKDKNGEFFDADEDVNAFNLAYEKNLEGMMNLPYPRKFLLKTIKIGCKNGMESVRYSNFLCEWMKRKINQISQ